jgi:hypothetical protein
VKKPIDLEELVLHDAVGRRFVYRPARDRLEQVLARGRSFKKRAPPELDKELARLATEPKENY